MQAHKSNYFNIILSFSLTIPGWGSLVLGSLSTFKHNTALKGKFTMQNLTFKRHGRESAEA